MNNAMATRRRMNFVIDGMRTSFALETEFWDALMEISRRQERSLDEIVQEATHDRGETSMSSAVRVFTVRYFREAVVAAK
jgi:predicted DNA-binding ribbon-helix-helix protein